MNLKNLLKHGLRNPAGFFKFIRLLPKIIRLHFRLLKDARVSIWPKLVFLSAVAYLIVPIDLISDIFLPVIGYADDLVILLAASQLLLRTTPPQILDEHVNAIDRKTNDQPISDRN